MKLHSSVEEEIPPITFCDANCEAALFENCFYCYCGAPFSVIPCTMSSVIMVNTVEFCYAENITMRLMIVAQGCCHQLEG